MISTKDIKTLNTLHGCRLFA